MATKKNNYNKRKPTQAPKESFKLKFDWARLKDFKLDALNLDLSFLQDKRFKMSVGLALITFSMLLLLSFLSALSSVRADQSVIQSMAGNPSLIEAGTQVKNWLGLMGATFAHLFIYQWFGVASFLLPPLLFAMGWRLAFGRELIPLLKSAQVIAFGLFWLSLLMGYWMLMTEDTHSPLSFYAGGIGVQMAVGFNSFIGWGTPLFLVLTMTIFVIYFFKFHALQNWKDDLEQKTSASFQQMGDAMSNIKDRVTSPFQGNTASQTDEDDEEDDDLEDDGAETPDAHKPPVAAAGSNLPVPATTTALAKLEDYDDLDVELSIDDRLSQVPIQEILELEIAKQPVDEEELEEVPVEDFDKYDPRLDLPKFQFPPLELLNEIDNSSIKVSGEELQENKNRIVKTLNDFKIGISSIKATIGPTVTLYEIVPKAGVKISRIKSLEDDIALSLSALGIRIIAPIPGKGTIGIEVPNKNRQMVSIRSVLEADKFANTNRELPIALGRTISNEVFVTDLTKMPHLLMAGATGQGKSVGLNVVLTSLLFSKHPAELKFVLIDPKKVELSLFSKIERHYLATLPDAEDAIITDTSRVVNTLNSLCVEMDVRYNLLKDAGCRNIKEYNHKFRGRRLNPENGHRFLPYIVLVIDELADLMMVAGKEVELPIARLAQLARAIGIHLIIATQRPSVNVITGIIKANFPARLSYKVTSKIDSRTILDTGGADQLVGMGDMLLSNGSELIRLQCAYIDTEEVERVCDYIHAQRGYDTAYLLPEFEDENAENKQVDLSKLDSMFAEAARMIVMNQQGSTSLLQRKLSLGYNRAGRIIDQLEAAGIVGPFEGSKARQVLISDETSLNRMLSDLGVYQ